MTHELNPEHQAIAETARAKVIAMISQSKVFVAEVVLGTVSEDES